MPIKICYAIIYILEACILWQYCRNLFPSIHTRRSETFTLFFYYSLLYIVSFHEDFLIHSFMFLIVNFIFIFTLYPLNMLAAFFHSLLTTMIMALCESGILSIISYYSADFYDESTYLRNLVILSVTSKLLYFFILQIISLSLKKKRLHELYLDKTTLFLNIIPLVSGFISLVFAATCMKIPPSLFLDILMSVSAVLLLAINVFLGWFHISIQEKNQKFLEMQMLLQKEYDTALYFDELHKQDEKQKILIHDIRKHLLSIANLNKKGETQKISAYIDQLVQSSDLLNSVRVCDNNLLNTIIFRTRQQCRESGTDFITDIRAGCTDFLSEYDITALFSNLLDNAVEATKNIPDSYIELNITSHDSQNITVTMINSCEKNPFSNNTKRLITTKKNTWRHGYGMKSIQRIVEKYKGDSRFYYDSDTDTFHTILILKNTK